jgi:hypothetical protein
MFRGCNSLQSIVLPDTSSAIIIDNMFIGCSALQSVSLPKTGALSNIWGMFYGCYALQSIEMTATATLDISNCSLSANALNALYTSLPSVTDETLTITGNPGANASNTKIATDKGWTITN